MAKKKPKPTTQITILYPVTDAGSDEPSGDRGGGKTHKRSVRGIVERIVGQKEIDVEKLQQGLEKCLDSLSAVFKKLETKVVDNWDVDSISIGLAISAEGSIGIVSGGLEGSIEVEFKRATAQS